MDKFTNKYDATTSIQNSRPYTSIQKRKHKNTTELASMTKEISPSVCFDMPTSFPVIRDKRWRNIGENIS